MRIPRPWRQHLDAARIRLDAPYLSHSMVQTLGPTSDMVYFPYVRSGGGKTPGVLWNQRSVKDARGINPRDGILLCHQTATNCAILSYIWTQILDHIVKNESNHVGIG